VLQWKNHEVTEYLMRNFLARRKDILDDLAAGMITEESMHKKNFDLGKLEIINELLDEDLYEDLIGDMADE